MQVITRGLPEPYALRLAAYVPNGGRLGTLPHHLGFEAGLPLNDVPSLKMTYSAAGAGSGWLAQPVELAVEVSVGGSPWLEPNDARFLRIKRGSNATDATGARTYDCPGYSWMLRKLVLYAGLVMADGKRPFSAVSAGAILRTFIDEGQARGALPGLAVSFSTTHDSAGQPWNKTLTLQIEPGTDLLTLLLNLSEQGVCDWTMAGRTLRVYNEGTVLAEDLASGPAPVDLRLGRDIDDAPATATLEDLATAILVRGDAGLTVERTNPSAPAPWGRWEAPQSQGGVTDQGTAILLGDNALQRAGRERTQLTRGIRVGAARWLPLAHYRPGDVVLAPGETGAMEPLRVRQITVSCAADGALSGNLVLNDRFIEREIRLARQAAGILAGGVSSGGTGGEPAPELPGGRVAAPPQGLVVTPAAYVDEYGFARGQVTATWSPVTADTAGVVIDPDRYELYARVNEAGQVWRLIASSDDTTATYSPLVVDETYGFKVRAVAQGTPGEFSAVFVVLIPDDVTPPPVPSMPVLSTRLGVIEVAWDGLSFTGAAMPSDFELVRVHMAADEAGPYEVVDHLRAAGQGLVADQPYNELRWFRLTALDRRGNESAPSAAASIATQPLVNGDLIGKILDGANIIDGTVNAADALIANTITGELIQALAIETPHLKANAVTLDKLAAGSVDAAKLTATAIDGKTITGAFIRTAATGRRLEFAPPGSTYPEIRFIPAGAGTNFTRLRTRDDRFAGEATFEVTSGTNSSVTAASQTTIAAGYMQMQVRDASLTGDNGGLMEVAESYASYGYMHNASDEQYFWFDSSGRTRHVGKWWDFTNLGSTAGILAGSIVFASAGSGANIRFLSYGTEMNGNMGPVCVLRRGLSSPTSHTPSGSWYETESLQTGFRISSSFPDGFAIYWWSHRH
ncbi:fibronectin type III domain-containing protein [Nonomuraea sp. PA05]|uniref:fibronectin type III domain-containing protein n=1 Tax=Nonomuraea sp. PA05 TaxID=2604466 RepID=UPI0011DAD04B|nr:fibronectin type III domain-containing protein [Nonomuraea sp. PA05]TYB71253.1 fibronectin type III domain-containing protein [Nonomuraea sp. PA05]